MINLESYQIIAAHTEDTEDSQEESPTSCWPFVCAGAKKALHKGLNIDKLSSRPVIRVGEKKQESPGWLAWIFGFELIRSDAEAVPDPEEEETPADTEGDDGEEEESDFEQFAEDDYRSDLLEMLEDLDEEEMFDCPSWYTVNLLGGEDWFSVDLLGPGYDTEDGRAWWEVNLLPGSNYFSWLTVNLFGLSGGRYWYEVNWLGLEETAEAKVVCAEVDHDSRQWFEVSWLGFCDDGQDHWYEVDLLGAPAPQGFSQEQEDEDEDEEDIEEISPLSLDLLGSDYQSSDSRNWYDVDLWGEPVIVPLEEEQEEEDQVQDSGYSAPAETPTEKPPASREKPEKEEKKEKVPEKSEDNSGVKTGEKKKIAEEKKKAEKEKKKAEADAKKAEKEKQNKINPMEMFKDQTDKFSKFDEKVGYCITIFLTIKIIVIIFYVYLGFANT